MAVHFAFIFRDANYQDALPRLRLTISSMRVLDFALLNDLALTVQRRKLSPQDILKSTIAERVGPLVELLILGRANGHNGMSPDALVTTGVVAQLQRVTNGKVDSAINMELTRKVGFTMTKRDIQLENDPSWTGFCLAAQMAAEASGLPKLQAQGLVGAMREIEENIHIHSQRPSDGIVGFRATATEFEFVVADNGIGALASLRQSPEYRDLSDPGTAVKLAITDGESRLRYMEAGRGFGFHSLFVGLANLNGQLRFRSDDHELTIDGTSPSLVAARLRQTALLQGFVASVVCTIGPNGQSH